MTNKLNGLIKAIEQSGYKIIKIEQKETLIGKKPFIQLKVKKG